MIVNFIEKGYMIATVELDFPPDNEDRIIINSQMYIVKDRIFYIGKKMKRS